MELCPGTVELEGVKGKLLLIKMIPSTVGQQLMPSHHSPFELGNEPGISLQTLDGSQQEHTYILSLHLSPSLMTGISE